VNAGRIGGRTALQREIAAGAVGREHKVIPGEGAVESQVNYARTLGDREDFRAHIEAQSCSLAVCHIGDVEGVTEPETVDREHMRSTQGRLGRIHSAGGAGREIQC